MNKQSYSLKTDRSLAVSGQWYKHLILFLIFSVIFVANAQAQNSCEAELREAQQKYSENEFDAARDLLKRCVNKKKASDQDKIKAYELLGKVFIAKDSSGKALEAFKAMLKLDCQITLDSTQVTPEVFGIFKESQKQQTCGNKNWLWITGGLAAAGGAVIIILTRDGDEPPPNPDDFVQPPGRPTGK